MVAKLNDAMNEMLESDLASQRTSTTQEGSVQTAMMPQDSGFAPDSTSSAEQCRRSRVPVAIPGSNQSCENRLDREYRENHLNNHWKP